MHRCFLDNNDNTVSYTVGTQFEIRGNEAIHILKVLRLKCGDLFEMCNNSENTFVCRIIDCGKKNVVSEIVNSYKEESTTEKKIFVFQSLSKGTKMDFVIQKSVELGAYMLVPVNTEFSVVKLSDEEGKLSRWRRISMEASKQCKRNVMMQVHSPVSFNEAVDMLNDCDIRIIAYEGEKETSLKSVIRTPKTERSDSIGMMIGPEGGFSKQEIQFAKESGITTVTLGKRILRTETAAVALLSTIMYEINELG